MGESERSVRCVSMRIVWGAGCFMSVKIVGSVQSVRSVKCSRNMKSGRNMLSEMAVSSVWQCGVF